MMLICIESWKGDCLICGKNRSKSELQKQLQQVESMYDRETDNFLPLLCRVYGWEIVQADLTPDYTYDRDTGLIF